MPSSYTASARFTLQATGENNNTWGAILNSGVFQLVDDNINGRLAFNLSGVKVLTSVLGATDEARMAFLDITGGTGGTVTLPAVPQGHYVRNASAGQVLVEAGGGIRGVFEPGDVGPVFCDGFQVYQLYLSGKSVGQYIRDADQAIIDYINAAISSGSLDLPPPNGNLGKALIVRNVGAPPAEAWVPSFIQQADVAGLPAVVATVNGLVADKVIARALYGDIV